MWSIGCIMAEMVNGKPLFMGTSEPDQLKKIFKIRGTPNESTYPGIKNLPEWGNNENSLEAYLGETLQKMVPKLEEDPIELLNV
jgi:serine/threonine protein kinase